MVMYVLLRIARIRSLRFVGFAETSEKVYHITYKIEI
jgi:NADPH-dependent curcumin reductase CurA